MGQVSAPALEQLQREMEARIAQVQATAQAQGRADGEAAAARAAMARLEPALNSLRSIVGELTTQRERARAAAEEDIVKLSLAIARRVLNRELATDPAAILGLVKAASAKLNAREMHRLRVSPADAAVIEEHRAKLELPPAVEVVRDTSLVAGSAVFETTRGEMDASVATQLLEIERGLTDVLRRRGNESRHA